MFDSTVGVMKVAICRLVLLSCVVSTMMAADAAVIDDRSWLELERLDVCSDVDNPSVAETCTLCPAALTGVSVWRCCHDPRAFADCTAAVDNTLEADKRKTKYFLGKKRGVKYFLGKRSFVDRGNYAALQPIYDRQQLAQEYAFKRPQHSGAVDKRVKYFLG